ncbi:ribonuclease III [Nitrospinae bacterium AH_259_B05_G02_I21]|nr:ribonuclease III [Nitrospinae bacterium AH_259_B05_G02_I21]MDA2932252.1 ribonuclease III [Nitrospinae bacterium AH-259-F20]
MPRPPLASLEEHLGYTFGDKDLLELALTHTSFAHEQPEPTEHNERLEFLGDAVLDLVLSEYLVRTFPQAPEGELSKRRSHLVNEGALAQRARLLDLGDHLRLGRGEELTGGRDKSSLLAGVYEAVVAALYLEAGYDRTRAVVVAQFADVLEDVASVGPPTDFKSRLQERCQEVGKGLPSYTVVAQLGPDHDKTFEVEVVISERCLGRGTGKNKREAEQAAARQALERLDQANPNI